MVSGEVCGIWLYRFMIIAFGLYSIFSADLYDDEMIQPLLSYEVPWVKEWKEVKKGTSIDEAGKWILKWATSWQNQQNVMCAQQRLRSAWASAQSDESLRCPHEEAWVLSYQLSIQRRLWTDWPDAQSSLGHSNFVGFFVRRLKFRKISVPVTLRPSFISKFYKSSYLDSHSSESIHIWTIGTLEGRLSFHDSWPQGWCPGVRLEVKI